MKKVISEEIVFRAPWLLVMLVVPASCGKEQAAAGKSKGSSGTVIMPLHQTVSDEAAELPGKDLVSGKAEAVRPVRSGSALPAETGRRAKIVAAARAEVVKRAGYDPKYYPLAYPGGDVPGGGVCTDLVVRALRAAGCDLQKLIHEDMKANFSSYPRDWGLGEPDPNIDHRRVPNLICFFRRSGLWLEGDVGDLSARSWHPGDVVFWKLGAGGRKHCGVISDRKTAAARPLVIHNLGGAAEEDCLNRWEVIGHARWGPRPPASPVRSGSPADDDTPKG